LLVVDDHPVVIEGLARLLRREEDLSVEWVAFTLAEAVQICQAHTPDLAIVDLSLGDGSGLDLIKLMHARFPDMPILVMSMHDASLYAERALRAGARGYITKQTAPQHVIEAVRRVRDSSDIYISDTVSKGAAPFDVRGNEPASRADLQYLSDRELEVFNLIGKGLRKREIAEHLGLSVNTIETHRAGIKKKLRLRSATELARFAFLQSSQA
jgi:DNA-binding NarL/FixJ family response regulator